MKMPNNNISPETIDFYMHKSRQVRSDEIFNAFKFAKHSFKYLITVLRTSKSIDCNDGTKTSEVRDQVASAK